MSQGAHLALRGGGKHDEGAGRRTQHNRGKATTNEPDLELEVPILLRVNATVVELVEALRQIAGSVESGPDGEDVLTWNGNGKAAGKARTLTKCTAARQRHTNSHPGSWICDEREMRSTPAMARGGARHGWTQSCLCPAT